MEQAQLMPLKHTSNSFLHIHLHEALMRHQGKIPSLFVNVSAQTLNQKNWRPILKLEYEITWQHTRKELRDSKMLSSNNEKKSTIGWQRCSDSLKISQQVELQKSVIKPIEVIDRKEEIKDEAANEPVRTAKENLMRQKVRELVKMPKSQPVSYYLKHKINKELIEGLVGNQRTYAQGKALENDYQKGGYGGNFVIPCNVRGLKYMDALVDQGSDVNIMPLSTYNRLTDKNLVKTDIRLSLASQSHIQPLGIAEEVLVKIAGFIYPVDFVILDIKEDRRKPFIIGTPFLTTAKAEIRFDKGTITLKSGKNKTKIGKIPEFLCKFEEREKDEFDLVTPTSIINKLI
ncbi:retrovirus-related pol polyprotein from transposon TNT 1-94 [Tanacetum coccineum]